MSAFDAIRCWLKRQDRSDHPAGRFDNPRRWYPSEKEKQNCCEIIRRPSAKWPYTLMTHCRSQIHVARLYGVTYRSFQIAAYLIDQEYESEEILMAIEATEKIKGKELSKQQVLRLAKRLRVSKEAA